jgi:hypothetical protein
VVSHLQNLKTKKLYVFHISLIRLTSHYPPPDDHNNIWWRAQIIKLNISRLSSTSSLSAPNILQPNVVVERLVLLPRIQEVLSSNHGSRTDYNEWSLSWYSSVPRGKCCDALKLGHGRFLPRPFQFIIYLSPPHSTLHSPSQWKSIVK